MGTARAEMTRPPKYRRCSCLMAAATSSSVTHVTYTFTAPATTSTRTLSTFPYLDTCGAKQHAAGAHNASRTIDAGEHLGGGKGEVHTHQRKTAPTRLGRKRV